MSTGRLLLSFAALIGLSAQADAQTTAEQQSLLAMRSLDAKVATIGHRLAVGGVDLCSRRQWLPGVSVHDLSQYGGAYRDAAILAFGLGRGPAILALAENGPADRSGLHVDDVLLTADSIALATPGEPGARTFDAVEHVLQLLEDAFADGHADLMIARGGETRRIGIDGDAGCPSRFQLVPSRNLNARADGRYVQVTTAIAEYVRDDQELAAVLAHEFAHNVLRHKERLDQARVSRGFMANFGRNARLIRETEAEADRLSVYLLDRAGYDPMAAIRFWTRFGPRGLSFLGSPTHPNWRARIRLFEAEIERIRSERAAGRVPVPAFLDGSVGRAEFPAVSR